MGSFKINGLDSLINDLSALAALPDSVAEDMLNAGADIIEAEQHKTAKSMGVYDTGVTEGSIKKNEGQKNCNRKEHRHISTGRELGRQQKRRGCIYQ